MSLTPSRAARLLAVSGLFLAVPLIAFEQRFGGANSQRGGNAAQVQQAPVASPTATPSQGQRSGGLGVPGGSGEFAWEWWKDEAVKKELKLTDDKVRAISRIYDARVRDMKPISDELQKQFTEQAKMARERTVDVAVFAIQVNRVEALRTELNKTRTVMFYQISRLLTPEQNDKLREIRDRRRASRGGGSAR